MPPLELLRDFGVADCRGALCSPSSDGRQTEDEDLARVCLLGSVEHEFAACLNRHCVLGEGDAHIQGPGWAETVQARWQGSFDPQAFRDLSHAQNWRSCDAESLIQEREALMQEHDVPHVEEAASPGEPG